MRFHLALTLALACDMPPLPEPSEPGTTAAGSTLGHSSTGAEPTSGSDSGVSVDATSSTGEPSPGACYADPCNLADCGPGLVCLPHPVTGDRLCVTPCGPPFVCNEIVGVACDAPPLPQVVCTGSGVILGCFPLLCEVPEDCTAPSAGCKNGVCY